MYVPPFVPTSYQSERPSDSWIEPATGDLQCTEHCRACFYFGLHSTTATPNYTMINSIIIKYLEMSSVECHWMKRYTYITLTNIRGLEF